MSYKVLIFRIGNVCLIAYVIEDFHSDTELVRQHDGRVVSYVSQKLKCMEKARKRGL